MTTAIYLEHGARKTFACAVDWPGWCRVAQGDDAAIALLASYAERYAAVAADAGFAFSLTSASHDVVGDLEVVEHVRGSGATDFGAPDAIPDVDRQPWDATTARRHADLLAASWRIFDRVVASAPAELRKGPRGGGRDRDEIAEHVAESERSYARQLGVRYTPSGFAEPGAPAALAYDNARLLFAAMRRAKDELTTERLREERAGLKELEQLPSGTTLGEQREAYSLLLEHGLIRVGLDVPADAEFIIDSVKDPNHCVAASNDVSVYRRPLPSTNLRFVSAIMWDGRESFATSTIHDDLTRQANNAPRGHAAAFRDITPEQARQIVDFEMGLFTAQSSDNDAGSLSAQGGRGGPEATTLPPCSPPPGPSSTTQSAPAMTSG